MDLSLQEVTQIVVGLTLLGKLSANSYAADDCIEPYPKLVRALQRGREVDQNKAIELASFPAYKAAVASAEEAVNLRGVDWPLKLSRAAARHEAGVKMEKIARKLIAGEDADMSVVVDAIHRLEDNSRSIQYLSDVKSEDIPYVPIGWPPLDDHIGGVPRYGVIPLGAPPKTGKTSLLLKFGVSYAKRRQKFMFFTMEMKGEELRSRFDEIVGNKKEAARLSKYIMFNDEILLPTEVSSVGARAEAAGARGVAIDMADLMVEGEAGEQIMSTVYKTLFRTGKYLSLPIFLAAQLTRGYSAAGGRVPRMTDFRQTGLAEALTPLVLLGHNPSAIYVGQSDDLTLPPTQGKAWLIVAASRRGFQRGKFKHHGPGAMLIDWDGEHGWGDRCVMWKDLQAT